METAKLKIQAGTKKVHVFPALLDALNYTAPADGAEISVLELLPQVVVGHRQWRDAKRQEEQFVRVEVEFRHDSDTKMLWVCLNVDESDLSRFGITPARLLAAGRLDALFRPVSSLTTGSHCFELREPSDYQANPIDVAQALATSVRPYLWAIVSTIPGSSYRRYYLHTTPPAGQRLPQIGSLWAILFYLGSIVRYRPHLFEDVTAGPFGPFITEFISAQPEQMLYMLASEMCRREVAKPAIA